MVTVLREIFPRSAIGVSLRERLRARPRDQRRAYSCVSKPTLSGGPRHRRGRLNLRKIASTEVTRRGKEAAVGHRRDVALERTKLARERVFGPIKQVCCMIELCKRVIDRLNDRDSVV